MPSKRLHLTDPAHHILQEAGNASAYVSRLIEDADQRWRHAYASLRTAGLTIPDLRLACDALNGTWMLGHRTASVVAMELLDAARINQLHEAHGVELEAWTAVVEQIRRSNELSQCMLDLAGAFWAYAPGIEAKLQLGPEAPQ